KAPHYLELDLRRHDVALEAGGDLDRTPGLLREGDGFVAFLKALQRFLRRREVGLSAGDLFRQENTLAAGLSGPVPGAEAIELLHVEVRHLSGKARVDVANVDRDNTLLRGRDGRRPSKNPDSVLQEARPVPLLEPKALHDRLGHGPTLENARQHIPVRGQPRK